MRRTRQIKLSQQGVALPTALILLLVITMLALATMQSSVFQEKMASNSQTREVAFQASEAGLREGEEWIANLTAIPTPTPTCSQQPCVTTVDPLLDFSAQTHAWWLGNAAPLNSAPNSGGQIPYVSEQPRYRIEQTRFVPDDATIGDGASTGVYYYVITARGTGMNNDAVTVLQSTAAKRY